MTPHTALTATQTDIRVPTTDSTCWTVLAAPTARQGAQRQGDCLVLPWPHGVALARQRAEIRASTLIPDRGIRVLPSHVLLRLDGRSFWFGYQAGGQSLGLLHVMPGAVTVLSHRAHGDLHIAEGTYVLRRQRYWTPTDTEHVED